MQSKNAHKSDINLIRSDDCNVNIRLAQKLRCKEMQMVKQEIN